MLFFTRIDIMDTIDISQNIQDFKQVFENESRIIFSARFGDGKSYFLNEFMKSFILLCIHEPLRKISLIVFFFCLYSLY